MREQGIEVLFPSLASIAIECCPVSELGEEFLTEARSHGGCCLGALLFEKLGVIIKNGGKP